MNTPTTGVLLVALGSPHYGRMAANLATSLRAADPDIPIHLVYSEQALAHLSLEALDVFHTIAPCPSHYYERGDKRTYFKAKTRIYDLTPFQQTLFLDVDMIWFRARPVSELIRALSQQGDFAIQHRGYRDLADDLSDDTSFWCNVNEVKTAYQLSQGRYYNLHSEFIFFKKSPTNAAYFEAVKAVYDNPLVPMRSFAGDMADEAAFSIAMAQCQHYPDGDTFVPVYWYGMDTRLSTPDMIAHYYAMSMGGSRTPQWVIERYHALANGAYYALRCGKAFTYFPKRQWEASRQLI